MPGGSNTFIAPRQTDAAYPARIGEPSVNGPVIYPEPQPNEPGNVIPFTRETGIDPSKIPSLAELTKKTLEKPNLKVLAGGMAAAPGAANQPLVAARNPAGPATTSEVVLGQTPAADAAPQSTMPWWGIALAVVGAGIVGYAIANSGKTNEPLVADMGDDEEEEKDEE